MSEAILTDSIQLKAENITLSFGSVVALENISFGIHKGEILSLVGPNGAGKTSFLNCITGFYHPQSGGLFYEGKEISGLSPHEIAHFGIARTFQNVELFLGMTTLDNIMAGRHLHINAGFLSGAIYWGKARSDEIKNREISEEIIDFLELGPHRNKVVAMLPYGLRKRVEMGRALAQKPGLLLLDEVTCGMNVDEKEDMARFILDLNEQGTTIVCIEHDMGMVMDISDHVVVLDFGHKIAEGDPDHIKVNPIVIKAYLGTVS